VQYHRARTNQGIIFEGAAFEMGQMTDDAAVAHRGGEPGSRMDHGSVLYGSAGSDGDGPKVPAEHGTRPDCRLGAESDIPDNDGVGMHIRLRVDGWDEIA